MNEKSLFTSEGKNFVALWNSSGAKGIAYAVDIMLAISPVNTIELCEKLSSIEIKNTKSKETLFREDSVATTMISSIIKNSFQGPSLVLLLTEWIEYIDSIPLTLLEIEINDLNIKKNNAARLETLFRVLVFQIGRLKYSISPIICYLFDRIRVKIAQSFGDDIAIDNLCSLFFLRFFCSMLSNHIERPLSITSPHEWLFPSHFTPLNCTLRRKLHLICKLLQLLSTNTQLDSDHPLVIMNCVLSDQKLFFSIREIIEISCRRGSKINLKEITKLPFAFEIGRIKGNVSELIAIFQSDNSKHFKSLIENLNEFLISCNNGDNNNEIELENKNSYFRSIECFVSVHVYQFVLNTWKKLFLNNKNDFISICAFKYSQKIQMKSKEKVSKDLIIIKHIFEKLSELFEKMLENNEKEFDQSEFDKYGELLAFLNIKKKKQLWDINETFKQSCLELNSSLSPLAIQSIQIILDLIAHNSLFSFTNTQLKSNQVHQIQNSWEKVAKAVGNNGGEEFYKLLFQRAPSVIPLFEKVNMDLQTKHLISVLSIVIQGASSWDMITDSVAALGRRHISYGAKVEHYPVVGAVLLELLSLVLKEDWTKEVERSWGLLVNRVATTMIVAQQNIEKQIEIEKKFQNCLSNNCALLSSSDIGDEVIKNQLETAIATGSFRQSFRLVELAVRLSWKESKIDPLLGNSWKCLRVIDSRSFSTPSLIFDSLVMIASIGFDDRGVPKLDFQSVKADLNHSIDTPSSSSSSSSLSSSYENKKHKKDKRKVASDSNDKQKKKFRLKIPSFGSDQSNMPRGSKKSIGESSLLRTGSESFSPISSTPLFYDIQNNTSTDLSQTTSIVAIFKANSYGGNRNENRGIRFWNKSFISYAGYESNLIPPPYFYDGKILGDKDNLELTQLLIKMGWNPPTDRSPFDLLPLAIEYYDLQSDQTCVSLIPIPPFLQIEIQHPFYKEFECLKIRYKSSELKLNYQCTIGGLFYPALAISHPCVAEEIVHSLLYQFNLLQPLAVILNISTNDYFWIDKVKMELFFAVVYSFRAKNIPIITNSDLSIYFNSIENNIQNNIYNENSFSLLSQQISNLNSSFSTLFPSIELNKEISKITNGFQFPWRITEYKKKNNDDSNNISNNTTKHPILILYASERGNTERYAKSLKLSLPKDLISYWSMDSFITKFPLTKLSEYSVVIFVVSTYINGGAPSNASKFYQRLNEYSQVQSNELHQKISLLPIRFAIFGFGSSTFESTFCLFKRNLEKSLKKCGGKELLHSGEGDEMNNADVSWNHWFNLLYQRLVDTVPDLYFPITNNDHHLNNNSNDQKNISKFKLQNKSLEEHLNNNINNGENRFSSADNSLMNFLDLISSSHSDMSEDSQESSHSHSSSDSSHKNNENSTEISTNFETNYQSFTAEVTRHQLVRKGEEEEGGGARSIFNIQINFPDLSSIDFDLSAGDHVAIIPENSKEEINWLAQYLAVDLKEIIKTNYGPMSVEEVLKRMDFQLKSPHLFLFKILGQKAELEKEKQTLFRYADKPLEKIPFYSVIDVLKSFHINIKLTTLLILLPIVQQPRFYSIANSPTKNKKIEIFVGVVPVKKIKRKSSKTLGFCSSYLSTLSLHQPIKIFFRNSHFHHPSSHSSPLILCCAGTGISSFIGFLKERIEFLKTNPTLGNCTLIFGCRNEEEVWCLDFLEKAKKKGALTEVLFAYSRPQQLNQSTLGDNLDRSKNDLNNVNEISEKKYVQDVIRENDKKISKSLLIDGAYFYFCGDGQIEMGVREELVIALENSYKLSRADAFNSFTTIRNEHRYVIDLWGVGVGDNAADNLKSKLSSRATNWIRSINRKRIVN